MSSSEMKCIRSYCRVCCHENNHIVLYTEKTGLIDDEYPAEIEYFVIKCLGCGQISYREDYHDYYIRYEDENGEEQHQITTSIYPPILRDHKLVQGYWQMPKSISSIYQESVNAIKSNCLILAGAGFRAVIEAICTDKKIKGSNLELKINNLSKDGLISKSESQRLHSVRFLGNDSIHEMITPTEAQLRVVLDIIEHLLKNIYLIDTKVAKALDKPIIDYAEFVELLKRKLAEWQDKGEFSLGQLLEKDIRRVRENFPQFEQRLISEISSNEFSFPLFLGNKSPVGESKTVVQHYKLPEIDPLY